MVHMVYILNLIYQFQIQRYLHILEKHLLLPGLEIFANNPLSHNLSTSVRCEINGLDLICVPCAPDIFPSIYSRKIYEASA
jgi:hypothetical protein